MKNYISKLAVFISLCTLSCHNELVIDETETNTIEENIKKVVIEEVSIEETISLLKIEKFEQLDELSALREYKKRFKPQYSKAYTKSLKYSRGNSTVIPVESDYKNTESEMVFTKIDGVITGTFVHKVREEGCDLNSFTGQIIITDINRKFLDGYIVENDVVISRLRVDKDSMKQMNRKNGYALKKDAPSPCIFCDDEGGGGGGVSNPGSDNNPIPLEEVVVYSPGPSYTPRVYIPVVVYSNSTIGGEVVYKEFTNNLADIYVIDFGSGFISANMTLSQIQEEIENELNQFSENFEDIINDFTLAQCLKNILNKLRNQSEEGVGYIITKFAGNTPGYKWEVRQGTLADGLNGVTDIKYDKEIGKVTTTFDSAKFVNGTDLTIARTIFHEGIHAYIISSLNVDRDCFSFEFPEYWQRWSEGTHTTLQNHHEEIARNYIRLMQTSLREYGESQGYNIDNQYYYDLAWGGLAEEIKTDRNGVRIKDQNGAFLMQDSSWFKKLVPNASDRRRIKDNISIELTGKDRNGNDKSNQQKGTKSNC